MSLGKTIVLLLAGLLLGTALAVGGIAFFTTRYSIESLRDSLMEQIDDGVQQKMQAYFDRVEPAIGFMEDAVFNEPGTMESWREPSLTLARFLKTEPDIMWLYYAERDTGHLLGVVRDQPDRYIVSRIHSDTGRIAAGYEVLPDGTLRQVELPQGTGEPYDARTRPWFLEAVGVNGLVWTRPYRFVNEEVIGITAAKARRDTDGRVLGVFAADLVLDQVAAFLDNIQVGITGSAFLLLEDGTFAVPDDQRENPHTPTLREALRSQSWDLSSLPGGESRERRFTHAGVSYVSLVKAITLPGDTRYFAGVIVPQADFFGVVWYNAWCTLAIAAAILVIAIFLGARLARRVTEPLAIIGEELDSIGKLRFTEKGLYLRSNIREVALFSDSVGKMKISLRAFSRYVPRDLVRLLLSRGDEAKLGGRLQSVTVVFTDLAGFTRMSEGLPPDEAFGELSDFLEIIADNQHRHGGITSNFTGDGTLAIFNAPENLLDHEQKACLASLDCLQALRELNTRRAKDGKPEFHARIGVNTAEVLLGNLGTRERFAYTAIGDGVNLASRLEGLNKLYGTEILVGEDCHNTAGNAFAWRKIDRIAVVGRTRPTVIYEPLGPAADVDTEWLHARDLYEKALEDYFARSFAEAEAIFEQAARLRPADPAAEYMAERCRTYAQTPPPDDWDGTFIAPFK